MDGRHGCRIWDRKVISSKGLIKIAPGLLAVKEEPGGQQGGFTGGDGESDDPSE